MQKKSRPSNGITNKTSWGEVSEWYDEYLEVTEDSYQKKVILPNVLRVLALKTGDQLLDIGCGQGFFTNEFSKSGATVSGSDISEELITIAKKKYSAIPFYAESASDLSFANSNSYDVVTCILAIQNMENMQSVFSAVQRILKKGGRLVLVVNHPAFRIPKQSSWGYDESRGVQYRRIDAYLSGRTIEIDMHPGKNTGAKTISYHRSFQDFFKALAKNGFAVTKLEEWISHKVSEEGTRKRAEDTARKEIPLFLLLEATKPD